MVLSLRDLDLDIYDAYYRNLDPQTGKMVASRSQETDGYEYLSLCYV